MRHPLPILLTGCLTAALTACATPGIPAHEWVVAPELSVSQVSESADAREYVRAVAPGVRGGYRWGKCGGGAQGHRAR